MYVTETFEELVASEIPALRDWTLFITNKTQLTGSKISTSLGCYYYLQFTLSSKYKWDIQNWSENC